MTIDAPTVRELIEIWNEAADTVADLGAGLDEHQWQSWTPCPGWRAGDIPAHVADVEGVLAQRPRPDHQIDAAALPHVTGVVGQFTEVGIDFRRSWPQADVIGDLRDVIAERRTQLDQTPDDAEIPGPMGNPTTLERLLRMRTFDIWVHEQDVRAAVSREGDWESRPASIALQQMLRSLPYVWARTVAAPEGSTLRLQVTGPLVADVTVRADADRKGVMTDPTADPTVHLRADWPDAMRLFCGRVPANNDNLLRRIHLSGDSALGAALLPAMAITP